VKGVVYLTVALAAASCLAAPRWEESTGFRSAPLPSIASHKPGFMRLEGKATGITFANHLANERSITNRNLLSGSGVAAGDIDADGLCDLFFCRLDGPCVLYRNLGNWKFEDVTAKAGVACAGQDSTAAVFADVDGDVDLDLLVNALGNGTRIFENNGQGTFKEITQRAGVASKAGSMSMALADIDGDVDLDLYVANFRPTTLMDRPDVKFTVNLVDGRTVVTAVNGTPTSAPEYVGRFTVNESGTVLEHGEVDALYLNDGRGAFTSMSFTNGAFLDEMGQPLREPPRDWGLAVQLHDFTGDGAPDIYVCNDLFTPDRIWVNDGRGEFRALPTLALRNTSTFSMGVDFGDLNRDGHTDFFVVDMLSPDHRKRQVQMGQASPVWWPVGVYETRPQLARNTLQVNRGDGTFAEIAHYAGVEASDWSWGPIFVDVDLDGYEDILVSNGQLRDFQNADWGERIAQAQVGKRLSQADIFELMKNFPELKTPNIAYRNRGDLTFDDVGTQWGFNTPGISQGMCLADLDNDGDMDVVMNNLNEEAGVYRNEGSGARVAVRLKGNAPNTAGIGAKITVRGGAVERQDQEMICGGRYLSGDQAMRVFATGSPTNKLTIEVTWRNGTRSVISNAQPNRTYEIAESGATKVSPEPKREVKPLFEDVSHLIQHRHVETPFNDFDRQPLVPWRLSQLGPGVAWHDIDNDGWEDLMIGSGKGGTTGVFRNDTKGGFTRMTNGSLGRVVSRDQMGVVGMGGLVVTGSANYEDGLTNGGAIRIYDVARGASGEAVLGPAASTGPVALADIDNDGDLDLFVGGRAIAGRYPEPATSQLLRNEGGRFIALQKFEQLGLVSGAVFSDLDGDGAVELIIACDWGAVRVFKLMQGNFQERTEQLGLAKFKGLWSGVTTGDLDSDGRLDIVACNWGLNTPYRASERHPRQLHYADIDDNGSVEIIESRFDAGLNKEIPQRGLRSMMMAMPLIRERIPTFEAYAAASVAEVLGGSATKTLTVNTLGSMVFFNRGDRFEGRALLAEAQWSPAFGVVVADLDGDGNEDAFLSQNLFATNLEMGRNDTGRALLLAGDGRGGLKAVPGQESGIKIYGEQRGCAVADYDGDARIDLVVAQNGTTTHLLRNVGATPGLRVRLKGPPGNATAVGASVRLIFGERRGPVREVHAGSGYLSQDGVVQVLATPESPKQIWVRWPGGATTTGDIPSGAREIEVNAQGQLRQVR
jgi:hypothetical protein